MPCIENSSVCNTLASNGRQCLKSLSNRNEQSRVGSVRGRVRPSAGKAWRALATHGQMPRAASGALGLPIDAPATIRAAATRHARRSEELVKEAGRLHNSYLLTVNGGARRAGYARRTGLFGDNSSLWSKTLGPPS